MSSRRVCRDRLILMLSRISILVLLVSLARPPAASAADITPTINRHQFLSTHSDSCLAGEITPEQLVAVIDCDGDSLKVGDGLTWTGGRLCLTGVFRECDSVLVITRIPHQLTLAPYSLRPYVTTTQIAGVPEPAVATENQRPLSTSNLEIAGSKSFSADVSDRGRTILAQGLTMTVTGELGHNVRVRGSFSDRGLRDSRLVTRRFTELENVYLEVESPRLRSVFGNFRLEQNDFALIGYQRSVQGLQLEYAVPRNRTKASVAVPLGNYAQAEFATRDGYYGPYSLTGRNGEQGVAVVENTEVVWLNGDRLQRGRDQDYYLDYLQGELYFTGRRIIDAEDRVRVEYEFQRLEYRKSLVSATNRFSSSDSSRALTVGYTGFLTSRDAPLDFTLSDSDIAVLERAGDQLDSTVTSGARFIGAGLGSYKAEVDTAGATIFTYVGENLGDYQVSFSEVVEGDYTYLGNGRYQYVGRSKGRFLPQKRLPLPETVHLVGVLFQEQFGVGLHFSAESIVSNYDRNRFSSRDDGDNNDVAGNVGLKYGSIAGKLAAEASAEIIPNGFPQIARLDQIEDRYLWQRDSTEQSGRKRLLAAMAIKPAEQYTIGVKGGYSEEESGAVSRRLNISTGLTQVARSQAQLQLNLASSRIGGRSRSLVDLRPEIVSEYLPVKATLKGEYDERQSDGADLDRSDSKREIESTLSYGGVNIGARLRENWQKSAAEWEILDRKRSVILKVSRTISDANKIDVSANLNRFSQGGTSQDYQTGSLSLICPSLFPAVDLTANYRLNRRGFSQTNQAYLKVDPGEGDYVLIDSIYVAQSRGDYIRVVEDVGEISQNQEAEKRLQSELDLSKLASSSLIRGVSFRYEVNYREVGNPTSGFAENWLLPPVRYFDSSPRLSQRVNDYRLRRYDRAIRLRTEAAYTKRRDENNLEMTAPTIRNSDEQRLTVTKSFFDRDNVQIALVNRERQLREYDRLSLDIREKRIETTASHFVGNWEWNLATAFSREHADSMDLLTYSIRVSPGINYNISSRGRCELSTFVLNVSEYSERPIFLQMAEGFPAGTHWGGRIKIDIGLSDKFSFKVIGQAEQREHDENRYFLRSELISKF